MKKGKEIFATIFISKRRIKLILQISTKYLIIHRKDNSWIIKNNANNKKRKKNIRNEENLEFSFLKVKFVKLILQICI